MASLLTSSPTRHRRPNPNPNPDPNLALTLTTNPNPNPNPISNPTPDPDPDPNPNPSPNQAKCQAFYLSDTLPRHLEYFAKVLSADATSPWLCGGASPTIADFYLATVVHNNFATKEWGTPVAIPAAVQANIDALYGLTAVKAFKAAEGKAK